MAAILFGEADAERFAAAIEGDTMRLMSAGNVLEASLVVEATLGKSGGRELDVPLLRAGIEVIPFTKDQLGVARRAHRTFGTGRHPASLNLGDCFSYALSQTSGEPLGRFHLQRIVPGAA